MLERKSIEEERGFILAAQYDVEAVRRDTAMIERFVTRDPQTRARSAGDAVPDGIIDRIRRVREERRSHQAAREPDRQHHHVDVRATHRPVLPRGARQDRTELVAAFLIGTCAAPTEEARIRLRRAWVERMRKYSVGVRLPDLHDRVQDPHVAFFDDTAGKQNMLAARYLVVTERQILKAINQWLEEKWSDRGIR